MIQTFFLAFPPPDPSFFLATGLSDFFESFFGGMVDAWLICFSVSVYLSLQENQLLINVK